MPIFTVFIFFLYNGCDFDSCKPWQMFPTIRAT
jgi:hypothetical protein